MCLIVIVNANAHMSQCLSGICTLGKRNSFPTSLHRSNLTGLVCLCLTLLIDLLNIEGGLRPDLSNMTPKKAHDVTVETSLTYSSR